MAQYQQPWQHGLLAVIQGNNGTWKDRLTGSPNDTKYQLAITASGGVLCLLAFAILRPRLPDFYTARKRQRTEAECLPELSKSWFGWIRTVYSVTEEQVLASVGLDAFVFLNFFKLAIKLLFIMLIFAVVVIAPVHAAYPEPVTDEPHKNKTKHAFSSRAVVLDDSDTDEIPDSYLWLYVVFTYLYTALALYFLVSETRRVIGVRQNYLGTQSSPTDRTLRLSGIPESLRSEAKIKEVIENLEIGKVEKVYLCRNTKELDDAVKEREKTLRKLESTLVKHMQKNGLKPNSPSVQYRPGRSDHEDGGLLEGLNGAHSHDDEENRLQHRMWYGALGLRYKKVDAIDYYENKLQKLDQTIEHLRHQELPTTPMAFVTMDSIAACQMAVQAVLDPSPLQLIATTSPSPRHVAWKYTYLSRKNRVARSWLVTATILILTVVWSVLLVPIASLIDLDNIRNVSPEFADLIEQHEFLKSLVQTQLPTGFIALLNLLVPFLYSQLSRFQGMISKGDVELSVISKNFFFTYFNFFIVFTVLGTLALNFERWGDQSIRQTALALARNIQELRSFYVNYIILQAAFINPFRLFDGSSLFLWLISRATAKTPREKKDARQPQYFSFGFSLPTTLLIFLMCIVYSILRDSWQVLVPGLIYFVLGYFIFKYQLLYAYNLRQHSTGRTWIVIVNRIIVGLIVFQIVIASQLALRAAWKRSVSLAPLVLFTAIFAYQFRHNYKPLMTHIALNSIHRSRERDQGIFEPRGSIEAANHLTPEDTESVSRRFVNPSLWKPLEQPWLDSEENGSSVLRSGLTSDASSEV